MQHKFQIKGLSISFLLWPCLEMIKDQGVDGMWIKILKLVS